MDNPKKYVEVLKASDELGKVLEWDKYRFEIPFINFPAEWIIRIVPPFMGAMVRFHIKEKTKEKDLDFVSVYLDCHSILAFHNTPYWEVYPCHGDVARCDMLDVEQLIENISEALAGLKDKEASNG